MLEPTGHSRQQKQRRNVLVTDKSCSLLLGGTRETLCRGNIQSSEREYRFKISLLLHLYLQWNLVVCNQVVRKSIVGLGTDEDSLTRAIVTRADIDMKKIKEEYRRYGTSINDDIKGDTSGYYMKFLLALVGWAIPWFEGLIDFMFAATQREYDWNEVIMPICCQYLYLRRLVETMQTYWWLENIFLILLLSL